MTKKKIGILGGTFNPVHTGHLLIAEGAREVLGLDQILFVPCAVPPLKQTKNLVSVRHRLAMVKLAVKGNSSFKISTIELDRGGVSYSIDTIRELCKSSQAKIFFIVGSDSLFQFSQWKNIHQLLDLCTLVVADRPGYKLVKGKSKILAKKTSKIKIIQVPTLPISSTDIRVLAKKKRSLKHLVPDKVREYIIKYRLYQPIVK